MSLFTTADSPIRKIHHAINTSLCTGCEACISVCPTEVLRLQAHKSTVAYYDRCIHCQKCDEVCPTGAMVTFPIGEGPRALSYPRTDPFFQSETTPGVYLIGEAAGRPLIKNAVNMGRAAVAHLASPEGGLVPGALGERGVDVIIIGAGPAGLSAALTCIELGLSYRLLERLDRVASTILSYPAGKLVMAEPIGLPCYGWLPVYDEKKDAFVVAWERLLRPFKLHLHFQESVTAIRAPRPQGSSSRSPSGAGSCFEVVTQRGNVYNGQRVIIAIGARGKLRQHPAKGSDQPHIKQVLLNPEDYRDKDVLVVGGGDSAVESALLLANPDLNNRVVLCVRGPGLNRANPRNVAKLEQALQTQQLRRFIKTEIKEFQKGEVLIERAGTAMRLKADAVILQIGADPPIKWLENFGIKGQPGILFNKMLPHSYCPPEPHLLVTNLLGPQVDRSAPIDRISIQPRPAPVAPAQDGSNVTLRLPAPELLIRLPARDEPRWTFPRKF